MKSKLIRCILDKNKEFTLSDIQKRNYSNVIKILELNPNILSELMTDETRQAVRARNQF